MYFVNMVREMGAYFFGRITPFFQDYSSSNDTPDSNDGGGDTLMVNRHTVGIACCIAGGTLFLIDLYQIGKRLKTNSNFAFDQTAKRMLIPFLLTLLDSFLIGAGIVLITTMDLGTTIGLAVIEFQMIAIILILYRRTSLAIQQIERSSPRAINNSDPDVQMVVTLEKLQNNILKYGIATWLAGSAVGIAIGVYLNFHTSDPEYLPCAELALGIQTISLVGIWAYHSCKSRNIEIVEITDEEREEKARYRRIPSNPPGSPAVAQEDERPRTFSGLMRKQDREHMREKYSNKGNGSNPFATSYTN